MADERTTDRAPAPGQVWRSQFSWVAYRIIAVACSAEDGAAMVVYGPTNGDGPQWVAAAAAFEKGFSYAE